MNESQTYKHLKFMVIATLISFGVLVTLLGVWILYPYHPIDTYPQPYKIVYPENKIVKQGEYITYEFKYTKTSNVIPTIQRQFVDGIIFNVAGEQTPTIIEKGTGIVRVQINIPDTLPPGKYYLRSIAKHQMNPIRIYTHESKTEIFEVISGRNSDAEQDAVDDNAEGR